MTTDTVFTAAEHLKMITFIKPSFIIWCFANIQIHICPLSRQHLFNHKVKKQANSETVKRGIALTGIVFLSHRGHVDFFWAGSSYSKSSSSGLLMKDKRELEQKESIFTSESSELMHSSCLTAVWVEDWAQKSHGVTQIHPQYVEWERRTRF